MRRRGGAGEIVDLVDLELERIDHVVAHKLEIRVPQEVGDVELAAGKEVVDRHDIVAVLEEAFAEMGTEKAGAAGDENAHGDK